MVRNFCRGPSSSDTSFRLHGRAVVTGSSRGTASGEGGVVAGGSRGTASDESSMVAGGSRGTAGGVVASGSRGTASGERRVVAGGSRGTASGERRVSLAAAGAPRVVNAEWSLAVASEHQ